MDTCYIWGCAYADVFVVLVEGLDMFVLCNVATGRRRLQQRNLFCDDLSIR
jgi:hypothetical protein